MAAQIHETGDDLPRRVRLHGKVDIGTAEARLQRVVLGLDPVDVDHQRRAVERALGHIGIQTGGDRERRRKGAGIVHHWVISKRPGHCGLSHRRPLSSKGDVTVAT